MLVVNFQKNISVKLKIFDFPSCNILVPDSGAIIAYLPGSNSHVKWVLMCDN